MKKPAPNARQPEVEQRSARGRQEPQPLAWFHARVRLRPRLLTQSPPWVRQVFDHDWAPMEALAAQARLLPARLWDYMLSRSGGFAVISIGESHYLPGQAEIGGQPVENVAFVSVEDLATGNERPLHVIGHLVDHCLGCGGQPGGPWLSEGAGVRPGWQQAGERLPGLFALGYGVDEVARLTVQDYFAQSLAIYCRDRQRLTVVDPQIAKWLRTTLFDERFWTE